MATYLSSESNNQNSSTMHQGIYGLIEAYKGADSHLWLPGEGAVTEVQLETFGVVYMIPENLAEMEEDVLLKFEDYHYTGFNARVVTFPTVGRGLYSRIVFKELWPHLGWAEAEPLPQYR